METAYKARSPCNVAGRQLTSRSAGKGLPGSDRMGPTILKLGVMGRSHSAAQSTGAIVSTSLRRSTGRSGLNPNFLLHGPSGVSP